MTAMRPRLVSDYLARLEAALAGLPRDRRDEIVDEVAEHIAAGMEQLPPDDEAGLRTLLERLGDPAQIAADARGDQPPASRRGFQETLAIVLLAIGGFLGGVGWLLGVVLLWISDRWTTRDKLIGTFVVPGGLALPLTIALLGIGSVATAEVCTTTTSSSAGKGVITTAEHCVKSGGTPLWQTIAIAVGLVALLIAPICTAVYLARRSR